MGEKLLNERIAVAVGLGEQQNPGGKTVDAMNDQGSLSFRLEFGDQERQSGGNIRALDRNRQKPGRLVEDDHCIVFIQHGNLAGETRLAPGVSLVFSLVFVSISAQIVSPI